MKVLMFGWEFPPHISGGLGTACEGIVKGLIENEVDIIMVVPKTYGDEPKGNFRLVDAGQIPFSDSSSLGKDLKAILTSFEVNCPVFPYIHPEEFTGQSHLKTSSVYGRNEGSDGHTFRFSGQYGSGLFDEVWNYALVCGEIARSQEFDLIHAHDWLSFPAGLIAKKITNKPLIVHVHSTEFDRSGEHINQQIFEIERQAMVKADRVIAVSELTRGIIIDRYGIVAKKVVAIHNALEKKTIKNPFQKNKLFKEKVICYLGRVTFQKGPEYFIEAAAKVLKRDKNFRFVMAGTGNMLSKMIELAARLRISGHIHFTGFLERNDVSRLLSFSNAYVMPSVSEPFGISPLEALQNNTPVIISRQSGVQEVLQHAIKVDFWNTDNLANAILALGKYQSLSKTLTKGGSQEVDAMDWGRQTLQIKNLYQNML